MNWQDEFEDRWYLHTKNYDESRDDFTTCGDEVKEFITSLLKKQRIIVADEWDSWDADMQDSNPRFLYKLLIYSPEPEGVKYEQD